MIDPEGRWIFIHIQKTGGSSIRRALGGPQVDPHKHRPAVAIRAACSSEVWERAFKFSFVRNPWDRLVSWWTAIETNARRSDQENVPEIQRMVWSQAQTFEQFLLCDLPALHRNQVDYLYENGVPIVDFIGRFERLASDFASIQQRIGAAPLPHMNRKPHPPYVTLYTPETAQMIGARFSKDVAAFEYRFGE